MTIYHRSHLFMGTQNKLFETSTPGPPSAVVGKVFPEAWDDHVAFGRGLWVDSKDDNGLRPVTAVFIFFKKKYNENQHLKPEHYLYNFIYPLWNGTLLLYLPKLHFFFGWGVGGGSWDFSVWECFITLTSKMAALMTLEGHDWWLATHQFLKRLNAWTLNNFSRDGNPYQNLNQNGNPIWNGSSEKNRGFSNISRTSKVLGHLMCRLWDANASSIQSRNDWACHAWFCKMQG